MLKVATEAKINGLNIESLDYAPSSGFPLLKAKVALFCNEPINVCAHGVHFSWSDETLDLLNQLKISMEKDCAKTYFGKVDTSSNDEYEVPTTNKGLTMDERFHDEYEVEQF